MIQMTDGFIKSRLLYGKKRALEEQNTADEFFSLVADHDNINAETIIEKDTMINDITVYKYVLSDSIGDKVQQEFQPVPVKKKIDQVGNENENPVLMDMVIPTGAFYRIQLGVYSKELEADAFGGLAPISAEKIKDRNLTRYYVGKFNKYDEAQKSISHVRSSGYKDAFIVAWYNGDKMSLEKAKKLEK